jgi:hypothetical protein
MAIIPTPPNLSALPPSVSSGGGLDDSPAQLVTASPEGMRVRKRKTREVLRRLDLSWILGSTHNATKRSAATDGVPMGHPRQGQRGSIKPRIKNRIDVQAILNQPPISEKGSSEAASYATTADRLLGQKPPKRAPVPPQIDLRAILGTSDSHDVSTPTEPRHSAVADRPLGQKPPKRAPVQPQIDLRAILQSRSPLIPTEILPPSSALTYIESAVYPEGVVL